MLITKESLAALIESWKVMYETWMSEPKEDFFLRNLSTPSFIQGNDPGDENDFKGVLNDNTRRSPSQYFGRWNVDGL
jgi:hypothetical protein